MEMRNFAPCNTSTTNAYQHETVPHSVTLAGTVVFVVLVDFV